MSCCCENSSTLELRIKKGESLGFSFTLSQNGSPIDLTGKSILFQVRADIVDDGEFLINKTITTSSDIETVGNINDATHGGFIIAVTSSETASLSTLKPYFAAIYYVNGGTKKCISANNGEVARLIVLNP